MNNNNQYINQRFPLYVSACVCVFVCVGVRFNDMMCVQALRRPDIAPANTLMSMFVGVNGDVDELRLPRHNRWVFPSWNHDQAMEVS